MTDSTLPPTFSAVLHLEIRRKGPRPGVPSIERQVYSAKIGRRAEEPDTRNCTLEHITCQGDCQQIDKQVLTLPKA